MASRLRGSSFAADAAFPQKLAFNLAIESTGARNLIRAGAGHLAGQRLRNGPCFGEREVQFPAREFCAQRAIGKQTCTIDICGRGLVLADPAALRVLDQFLECRLALRRRAATFLLGRGRGSSGLRRRRGHCKQLIQEARRRRGILGAGRRASCKQQPREKCGDATGRKARKERRWAHGQKHLAVHRAAREN